MPPAKKPKAAAAAADDDEAAALSAMLRRCSRSSLEALLLTKFKPGGGMVESLKIEEVAATLAPVKIINVGTHNAHRVGTGAFDDLDFDIFSLIVAELPLPTRLLLATRVCTGWRALKNIDHLWTALRVRGQYQQEDSVVVSRTGFTRLLKWVGQVPEDHDDKWCVDKLTELRVHTGDVLSCDALKDAFARTSALCVLHLDGKKVTAAVMKAAAQAPFAAHLKELSIGGDAFGSEGNLEAMLMTMAALETLELPCKNVSRAMLEKVAAAWRGRRGGAAPLLSRLVLGRHGYNRLDWGSLQAMGSLFPELETLKVGHLLMAQEFGPDNEQSSEFRSVRRVDGPLEPMPRLREFALLAVSSYDSNVSTRDMAACLRHVCRAAPALERLCVAHGRMSKEKARATVPLPRPTDEAAGVTAFEALPPSLRSLELSDLDVRPDDFGLAPNLPELRSFTIANCGEYDLRLQGVALKLQAAEAVAERLRLECPLLTESGCVVQDAPLKPSECFDRRPDPYDVARMSFVPRQART